MGVQATSICSRCSLFPVTALFFALCLCTGFTLFKVDQFVSTTKTVIGHNLDPTPWHPFPPKHLYDESRYVSASKIIQCSYLKCRSGPYKYNLFSRSKKATTQCPSFFRWIHHDLEPWAKSRMSMSNLIEAQKSAAFRVVIVGGRLFVDFYYDCVQSRAMFTLWGLLQLLRRYPGMVPDVDIMFDCMDRPSVSRTEYGANTTWPPPPLFRYCTTSKHFDIPFPDWSFWGWAETNIEPWDEEFKSIKQGARSMSWIKRSPLAYWKGNTNVSSPVRIELLRCNPSENWGAQIMHQDWLKEAKAGYQQSKLANQCKHRYKIYAEGYAWSVSLKYILSCGSLALIISPQYEDFLSRGLIPEENYWPVSLSPDLCQSIKFAVDWGNANPAMAEEVGKRGKGLMEEVSMDRVYDYMYHLINEYSKLQNFQPSPPPSAQEVCMESLLCFADANQREFLERSTASPSSSFPCNLPPPDSDFINKLIEKKSRTISDIQESEKVMHTG